MLLTRKHLISYSLSTAIAAALVVGTVAPASAFEIYEDSDYSGYAYHATWPSKQGLGTINRQGSSIASCPGKTFYENMNLTGRHIYLAGNTANLSKLDTNLAWYESWNDRIQSYR